MEEDHDGHPITQERLLRWAKAVGALIIATAGVTAAWLSMGLPVPATTAYVVTEVMPIADRVADLEKYAKSTRLIILRQKQGLLLEEIRRLEDARSEGPGSPHLTALIRIKQQEIHQIEKQLSVIEGGR